MHTAREALTTFVESLPQNKWDGRSHPIVSLLMYIPP
jgi:hypothetical protein